MKNLVIIFAMTLILFGLTGCGKSEGGKSKKYIGRYVSKDQKWFLEIKKDGTFELENRYLDVLNKIEHSYTTTGEWEIGRSGLIEGEAIKLYDVSGTIVFIGERKGNTLINRFLVREVYIKQD